MFKHCENTVYESNYRTWVMLGGAYLECLDGSLTLLLQLLQLVLLLLLQVSECVAMLLLHAGHSGSMLLLCCPHLGLQSLSLGLAVTDLMPVISKYVHAML